MEKDISIRLAVPTDATKIENVARLTWQSTYSAIISPENQERLLGRWYAPPTLNEAIIRKDSWFFVALLQSALIGFAQFILREEAQKSGELSRIYVLPEYQRFGVGGLLLNEGVASLSQKGINHLFVVVEKDNLIGRRFYEKKGFYPVREFAFELPNQNLLLVEYQLDELVWAG